MRYDIRFKKKGGKNWGKEANRYISDGLYHDCSKKYRNATAWGPCPDGMAAYGIDEGDGAVASCGVLPADDILSSNPAELNVMRKSGSCNANEIITGALYLASDGTSYVLCSKINTARYKLGNRFTPSYWGSGSGGSNGAMYKIDKSIIPAEMRYTLGRVYLPDVPGYTATNFWDGDGCVGYLPGNAPGYQWGFIFVKYNRTPHDCGFMSVVQLQYAGAPGDPAAGTGVNMFPQHCSSLDGNGALEDGACKP